MTVELKVVAVFLVVFAVAILYAVAEFWWRGRSSMRSPKTRSKQ